MTSLLSKYAPHIQDLIAGGVEPLVIWNPIQGRAYIGTDAYKKPFSGEKELAGAVARLTGVLPEKQVKGRIIGVDLEPNYLTCVIGKQSGTSGVSIFLEAHNIQWVN